MPFLCSAIEISNYPSLQTQRRFAQKEHTHRCILIGNLQQHTSVRTDVCCCIGSTEHVMIQHNSVPRSGLPVVEVKLEVINACILSRTRSIRCGNGKTSNMGV